MSDQAQPRTMVSHSPQQMRDIGAPHDHDVLSGRGNYVNYHPGNEYFRALVKKHKMAYVACPKPQKAKYSRLIVDEIRSRDPSGRFLKQDDKTKLWYDIGDKKALDKTRQALREGAPELLKGLGPDEDGSEEFQPSVQKSSYDVTGGMTRLSTDAQHGGLSYNASSPSSGMHSVGVHAESVPSSSHVMSSDPRRMQAPTSQSGRVASIPMAQARIIPQNSRPDHASMNVAAATQNLNNLQKQLASSYPPDQFEPTPINPNLSMQIEEAQAQLQALQRQIQIQTQQLQLQNQSQTNTNKPPLERDDSLKFQELFATKDEKPAAVAKPEQGHNSSVLSAMSFSVGEMTVSEESNLSAVFEDSVRISDTPRAKEGDQKVPKEVAGKADPARTLPSSGGKPPSTKSLDKSLMEKSMMDSLDMSTMTFSAGESTANLGSSFANPLQMSFTRVFDESSSDFNKK